MSYINEYHGQIAIRNSDKVASTLANSESNDPLISSDTWQSWSDKFEAGAKAFGVIGGGAGLSKDPRIQTIGTAANATAAVATVLAEAAKQQAESAKAKEKQNAERKAFEKQLKEGMDRSMRDHNDRMSRGEYRDPPSRERMAEIGRMA